MGVIRVKGGQGWEDKTKQMKLKKMKITLYSRQTLTIRYY